MPRMHKPERITLFRLEEVPTKLQPISAKWTRLANAQGDHGGCVLGAGFSFTFEGKDYFLRPMSMWQGSCSWEHDYKEIGQDLAKAGCTNIEYHWGILD